MPELLAPSREHGCPSAPPSARLGAIRRAHGLLHLPKDNGGFQPKSFPPPRLQQQPAAPGAPTAPAPGTDRFAEGQEDLTPQDVEEVGRSGAVDDDPVAVVQLAHVEVVQLLPQQVWVRGCRGTAAPDGPAAPGTQPLLPPQPPAAPSQSTGGHTEHSTGDSCAFVLPAWDNALPAAPRC